MSLKRWRLGYHRIAYALRSPEGEMVEELRVFIRVAPQALMKK
jgi:hypothetical protein